MRLKTLFFKVRRAVTRIHGRRILRATGLMTTTFNLQVLKPSPWIFFPCNNSFNTSCKESLQGSNPNKCIHSYIALKLGGLTSLSACQPNPVIGFCWWNACSSSRGEKMTAEVMFHNGWKPWARAGREAIVHQH